MGDSEDVDVVDPGFFGIFLISKLCFWCGGCQLSDGFLFFTYRLTMSSGITEIAFASFCSTVFDMFYYRCSGVLSAVVACSWFPCLQFLFHFV